ncbi:MAG TPA: M42 family metallopeptidase [Solirubrobacterales bacterium]|nr:M42 family metallopeptidase [Solirubrobacterales bacterium]
MTTSNEVPKLLDELLRAGAPSGYEGPAADVWRKAASAFAELSYDGIGSTFARVGSAEPLIAIVGHIDEIGLIVTHIDEKGFLWFEPIGGWDPQVLVGQRVEVTGTNGPVPGVAGRKPIHLLEPDQRKKVVELKSMHIDIGVTDREEAEALVRVGDPVVIRTEPMRVAGSRLVSKSMDNRLGAYVAAEATRRCAEGAGPGGSVVGVAAVQEEIGLFGARTSAFALKPDIAVAVDVTHATDAPGVDEKELGSHPLGSGPVIGRGSTLSPKVFELLVETAEAEGIEYTVAASGRSTGTDADSIQIARSGIPTGLVSIPLRYMHSPVEMVDLADVEAVVNLLAAFASRTKAGVDLSR